ncbi:MAG TPA: hypothetical protein VN700_12940 [Vicinamibacterales bacterium]|nr:hypothetical protein [Vicinamibacterales bacterium]
MSHPTEDELIQHLCGEDGPRDRERIQDHLASCAECQVACAEITGALTLVNESVPEPPDGFERIVWAHVQQQIAVLPVPSRWTWRSLVPAGAVAALAVAGIAIASRPAMTPKADVDVALAEPSAPALPGGQASTRDLVLYTALDNHFRQTEMLLVEVRNASDRDSLDYERMSAQELITAGRLYRMTAEDGGHPRLVQMLDELEPVLVEVARGQGRPSKNDRAWFRARIDEDALLFKVRAATNDIRERVGHAND